MTRAAVAGSGREKERLVPAAGTGIPATGQVGGRVVRYLTVPVSRKSCAAGGSRDVQVVGATGWPAAKNSTYTETWRGYVFRT